VTAAGENSAIPGWSDIDSRLRGMVDAHSRRLRSARLMLYAGAALLTDDQSQISNADLGAMPAMGWIERKEQPGSATVAELERLMSQLACLTFGCGWADLRLPSCTIANLAVFSFMAKPGDLLLGPAAGDGGHLSQRRGGTPSVARLEVSDLPFDPYAQQLDSIGAANLISKTRPRLVMLGRSVILGPDPLEDVMAASRMVRATTIFDASHVSGLIASRAFENPLAHGVDVVTSSTYKTLGGPPGGMVLFRDPELGRAFSSYLDDGFLANQNATRFPAIISAIWACRPETGYGAKVLSTAETMKSEFRGMGIEALLPSAPAKSHQVVVPVGSAERARAAMQSLESAGILVGTCPAPGRRGEFGLRFGSQVISTMGLVDAEVREVAQLIGGVLESVDFGARLAAPEDPICRNTQASVEQLLEAATGRRASA
jgi:glycine hydroxymethyltransferase